MSSRIIQLPLSGRDRRQFKRELTRVEELHARLLKELGAAIGTVHRLECQQWNARQFIWKSG